MNIEKIEDLEIYEAGKQKDIVLRGDYHVSCNWYSSLKKDKQIKFTEKQIININKKILKEIFSRGNIKFSPDNMQEYSKELFFRNIPFITKKFIEVKNSKKIFLDKDFSEIEGKIKKKIPYFIIKNNKVYGVIGLFKDFKILASWKIPLISKIEDNKIIIGGFEKEILENIEKKKEDIDNKEIVMKPYPNEHSARINSPDKYIRFRRQNNKLGQGIHVIFGITEDEKVEIQTIRFSSSKFSVEEAKTWLKDHDFKPIKFEPAIKKESYNVKELKNLPEFVVASNYDLVFRPKENLKLNETPESKSKELDADKEEERKHKNCINFENGICKLKDIEVEPEGKACSEFVLKSGLKKEEVKFVLQKHWFEKQVITRFGPSNEHWDLRIDENKSTILHWVCEKNLIETAKVTSYIKSCRDKKSIDIGKNGKIKLKSGTAYNPTKDTPAWIEAIDWGNCVILEKNKTFTKIEFNGKILKGLYVFKRKSESSPFYLIETSKKLSQKKFKSKFEKQIPIIKADSDKHIVFGIVYTPYEKDAQGDWALPEEIKEAAHKFLRDYRIIKLQHQEKAEDCSVVESYVTNIDQDLFGKHIKKGTWLMVTEIKNPKIWDMIVKGELIGFSMAGTAQGEE